MHHSLRGVWGAEPPSAGGGKPAAGAARFEGLEEKFLRILEEKFSCPDIQIAYYIPDYLAIQLFILGSPVKFFETSKIIARD